jgi:hypothetical protein
VQAPAYGHGKKGRKGINGVEKVRRGYIVKFPHPMYFSSALLSMAVGWCLHRLLRRKTKKQNSSDSPSMAVCVCYALQSDEGKNTWGVDI